VAVEQSMSWFSRRRSSNDGWAPWQAERLEFERAVLTEFHPDFALIGSTRKSTIVRGRWTSPLGISYTIEIYLSAAFPDEAPRAYVADPFPLRGYGGVAMHTYGASHQMHTFQSNRDRSTQICAVHPDAWDASWSLAKVIQKVRLWIVAYEFHKESGKPVDAYLLS
jgi:hypothetical protein